MQNEDRTKEKAKESDAQEIKPRDGSGTVQSRNSVVEENLGLVYMVLRRFSGKNYDMEELFQVGCIGLLKAAERFDAGRNLAFSTYAVPLIIGEIRRFLRDDGRIHVSRQIKEDAGKIAAIREQWKKKYNKEPTLEELERELGMEKEAIIMAIGSQNAVTSIYQQISEQEDGKGLTVEEGLADERNEQAAVINRLTVSQLMEELDEDAKKLIVLRYLRGMTQMQTAKSMGINQVAVSRMEKKILLQLRKKF